MVSDSAILLDFEYFLLKDQDAYTFGEIWMRSGVFFFPEERERKATRDSAVS